jgi:hypothetical protein
MHRKDEGACRRYLSTFKKAFPTFVYHSPDSLKPSSLVQEVEDIECNVIA